MSNHERTNAAKWDATISPHQPIPKMTRMNEWQVVTHARPSGLRSNALPAPLPNTRNGSSFNRGRVPQSAARESLVRHQLPRRPRDRDVQKLLIADEPVAIAETTWRQRGPPAAVIRIPTEVASLDKKYMRIAREHEAFIHTLEEPHPKDRTVEFGVWGAPVNVQKAKHAIVGWLNSAARAGRSSNWAKIYSLTPAQRDEAERQWRRDVQKEKYRQHPPFDMPHHSIGHFHWPDDEECRPDEVWGKSYEALDPIRMGCDCYVVWIADELAFRVMGQIEDVKCALQRIRMAYFQVVARDIGPVNLHVLRVPEGSCLPDRVPRERYCDSLGSTTFGNVQPTALLAPMGKSKKCSQSQQQSLRKQAEIQALHVKHLITNALSQLHYFRGRLELRFRLGRLLLERVVEPPAHGAYMLDDYLRMTEASLFKARVTEE
jgi:hypothetical protein